MLITSQNHGFLRSIRDHAGEPPPAYHVSLFDGSNRGLRCTDVPRFSFQGTRKRAPGPHDVAYLFDRFIGPWKKCCVAACPHADRAQSRRRGILEARQMPKRTDIKSILIIGAGPIVIGQACEFDYSGAQACKALREEGYRVILVNSNPATIMTDRRRADVTYIEPITWQVVAHHRQGAPLTRSCRPWAARPRSTARSTSAATACSTSTASS